MLGLSSAVTEAESFKLGAGSAQARRTWMIACELQLLEVKPDTATPFENSVDLGAGPGGSYLSCAQS
jgi:hypothetical protein